MVLRLCRQLVDDEHLAEDAFQATFLVLARKSRSIRDCDQLGNWLYGVASRTARCAQVRLARQRQRQEADTMLPAGLIAVPQPTQGPAEGALMAREELTALHSEIERLPDRFRLPVVLCYLEGMTVQETAQQLRWPHGTVRSRLARARKAAAGAGAPRVCRAARRSGCCARIADRFSVGFRGPVCADVSGRPWLCCRSVRCYRCPFGFRTRLGARCVEIDGGL